MQEFIFVTGIVIKTIPIGDFDRRITILTKEFGKINCFAKGARKPNSRFLASTNPFSFGVFKLYAGKNSYNLLETNITHYFEELRGLYEEAYYAMYFLEVADHFTRENNDEREMLKLLFQSIRALTCKGLSKELVQAIFEIRVLVAQGEFPGVPEKMKLLDGTMQAVWYIESSSIEKLFTFQVSDVVLSELSNLGVYYRKHFYAREFKSIQIIEQFRDMDVL